MRPILGILTVLCLSFNLRRLLTSVAPLLHDIQTERSLSNFWISILLTVPVLCVGVFCPLAAPFTKRLGLEGVLLVAIAAILMGAILRSFGLVPLYLGTVLIGAGISLIVILTTALIKRDFSGKVGAMMGLFSLALGYGASRNRTITAC